MKTVPLPYFLEYKPGLKYKPGLEYRPGSDVVGGTSLSVRNSLGTFFRYSQFWYVECQLSISVQSLSVHTKYRYSQLWYINVNFWYKRLRYKSTNEPISGAGAL